MSDTGESMVAESVDSGATMSPSILWGLERLKCRTSNRDSERNVEDDGKLLIGINAAKSRTDISSCADSQATTEETQIDSARYDSRFQQSSVGSPEFPAPPQKLRKFAEVDDLPISEIGIEPISEHSVASVLPPINKPQNDETYPSKPDSKQESQERKKKLDDQHTTDISSDDLRTQCLDPGCICKEANVSLERLKEVQDSTKKSLKAHQDKESPDQGHTRHLLATMQQQLRHLSKMQHNHLQNLRQLMQRPTKSQLPDLKSQLKQIMNEKQQMLQLLKTHRNLSSELQIAIKESSRGTDENAGSSQSDSLKSLATRSSSSAYTETTQMAVLQMVPTSSYPAVSCPPPAPQTVVGTLGSKNTSITKQRTSVSNASTMVSSSLTVTSKTSDSGPSSLSEKSPLFNVSKTLQPSDESRQRFLSGGRKWSPPFASVNTASEQIYQHKNAIEVSTIKETSKFNETNSTSHAVDPKSQDQMFQNRIAATSVTQGTSHTKDSISDTPFLTINDDGNGKKRPDTNNSLPVRIVSIRSAPNTTGKDPVSLSRSQPLSVADINKVINVHLSQQRQNSTQGKNPKPTSTEVLENQNLVLPTPGAMRSKLQPAVPQANVLNLHIPSRIPSSAIIQTTGMRFTTTVAPNQISYTMTSAPTHIRAAAGEPGHSMTNHVFSAASTGLGGFNSTKGPQIFPTPLPTGSSKGNENNRVASQQRVQQSQQIQRKSASMVQLLEAKLLLPGHDVLSFTCSGNGKVYRASLDSKGYISDGQRGCFSGPSQWTAALMNRSVSATSKLAWKSVLFKGKSLAMLQQQWARRQAEPFKQSSNKTFSSGLPANMIGKTAGNGGSLANSDPRNILLASNLMVQLLMTEELIPTTKEDWENIPPHLYADIDKWE